MKVLILGNGEVGTAVFRHLVQVDNYQLTITGSKDCDLRSFKVAKEVIGRTQPDLVILAAGVSGGIQRNLEFPADMMITNLNIITNTIEAAFSAKIKYLINIAPSCVYPGNINRRMKPDDLFLSPMESTSLSYSTAKLAGIILVESFRKQYGVNWTSVVSTNLYSNKIPTDLGNAHVLPVLLSKIKDATETAIPFVELIGDGSAVREFLHVDDFANAVAIVMEKIESIPGTLNISGTDEISIMSLAQLIKKIVGYQGEIKFRGDKLNGAPMKLLDGSYIRELGWKPKITLENGISLLFSTTT